MINVITSTKLQLKNHHTDISFHTNLIKSSEQDNNDHTHNTHNTHNDHIDKMTEIIPTLVYGDSVRVLQVSYHLLSNACKFTDKGSVHLHVSIIDDIDDAIQNNYITRKDSSMAVDVEEKENEEENKEEVEEITTSASTEKVISPTATNAVLKETKIKAKAVLTTKTAKNGLDNSIHCNSSHSNSSSHNDSDDTIRTTTTNNNNRRNGCSNITTERREHRTSLSFKDLMKLDNNNNKSSLNIRSS